MTNKEILKKVIYKATENGFKMGGRFHYFVETSENYIANKVYYNLIFSHSFAEAFWKEPKFFLRPWKWHLQQMVLEKNPLKYLEKYI